MRQLIQKPLVLNILILAVLIAVTLGISEKLHTTPPQFGKPVASSSATTEQAAPAKETMPDFDFQTIDGKSANSAALKGKIIILNFWATWCAPCVIEFPQLLALAAQNPDNAVLLAVSSDHDVSAIMRFIEKLPPPASLQIRQENVLLVRDESGRITQDIFQTYRLPETVIIDKNHKMARKLIGADWQTDEVQRFIEGLK